MTGVLHYRKCPGLLSYHVAAEAYARLVPDLKSLSDSNSETSQGPEEISGGSCTDSVCVCVCLFNSIGWV